jgi:hypothetical protein
LYCSQYPESASTKGDKDASWQSTCNVCPAVSRVHFNVPAVLTLLINALAIVSNSVNASLILDPTISPSSVIVLACKYLDLM